MSYQKTVTWKMAVVSARSSMLAEQWIRMQFGIRISRLIRCVVVKMMEEEACDFSTV